jgi:hypothetical protein
VMETSYELTSDSAVAELARLPTLGNGVALGAALAVGAAGVTVVAAVAALVGAADGGAALVALGGSVAALVGAEDGAPPAVATGATGATGAIVGGLLGIGVGVAAEPAQAESATATPSDSNTGWTRFGAIGLPCLPGIRPPWSHAGRRHPRCQCRKTLPDSTETLGCDPHG